MEKHRLEISVGAHCDSIRACSWLFWHLSWAIIYTHESWLDNQQWTKLPVNERMGTVKIYINKYGNVLHLTWLAITMQLDVFIEAFQLHTFAFIFIFPFKNCFQKNIYLHLLVEIWSIHLHKRRTHIRINTDYYLKENLPKKK